MGRDGVGLLVDRVVPIPVRKVGLCPSVGKGSSCFVGIIGNWPVRSQSGFIIPQEERTFVPFFLS